MRCGMSGGFKAGAIARSSIKRREPLACVRRPLRLPAPDVDSLYFPTPEFEFIPTDMDMPAVSGAEIL